MSEYGNVLETNVLEDFIGKTFCDAKTVNEDEELHFSLKAVKNIFSTMSRIVVKV